MRAHSRTLSLAIILFLLSFAAVNIWKPSIMFNEYGQIRPFGLGYKHKTVIPIWIFVIVAAILSYLVASEIGAPTARAA